MNRIMLLLAVVCLMACASVPRTDDLTLKVGGAEQYKTHEELSPDGKHHEKTINCADSLHCNQRGSAVMGMVPFSDGPLPTAQEAAINGLPDQGQPAQHCRQLRQGDRVWLDCVPVGVNRTYDTAPGYGR